jgi:hypothetical protein
MTWWMVRSNAFNLAPLALAPIVWLVAGWAVAPFGV